MIQVTPQMKIWVALEPVDFRKGLDGLAAACRSRLGADPFSGALFVFRSRSARSIRVLGYDGQGLWLFTKRMSTGSFRWWPAKGDTDAVQLLAHELQVLIFGGDPRGAKVPEAWRPLKTSA